MLTLAALALAATPQVQLVYEPPAGAACPSEAEVKQMVAAKLGVDPFVAEASTRVSIRLASELSGEVALESPGAPIRRKSIAAPDCVALLQSAAVTVALAVDPLIVRPQGPAEPVKPPEPLPPPQEPPAAGAPPLAHDTILTGGAGVSLGLAQAAQPVVRFEGRIRFQRWSLGLEGRFHAPVTGSLPVGLLTASALLGALVPCVHIGWFAGCVEAVFGGLRLEGTALAGATAATVFHSAAGLRLAFQVPITHHLGVGLLAEGQVPMTRAAALVGPERVWTVPPAGGGLSAVVSWRL